MREMILKYIRDHGDASFANLQSVLGDRFSGPLEWEIGNNVILWANISQEFGDVMAGLKKEGLVEPLPTSLLVYMVDGALLQLPIAKRIPKNGFKKPHWLPVIFKLTKPGKEAACALGT